MSDPKLLEIRCRVDNCKACLMRRDYLHAASDCVYPGSQFKDKEIPDHEGDFPDGCPLRDWGKKDDDAHDRELLAKSHLDALGRSDEAD